jgi:hypothetical protein
MQRGLQPARRQNVLRLDLLVVAWKLLEHRPVNEAPGLFLMPRKNWLDGIVRG